MHYHQWERDMQKIKRINQDAHEWLLLRKNWSMHAFSCESKCASFTNHLCEVFNNATILKVRDQPITSLCKWIQIDLTKTKISE